MQGPRAAEAAYAHDALRHTIIVYTQQDAKYENEDAQRGEAGQSAAWL
jgi:hypothetical protein